MALFDETAGDSAVVSYVCRDGTFPSVGAGTRPRSGSNAPFAISTDWSRRAVGFAPVA